jgi:hypothetical protein
MANDFSIGMAGAVASGLATDTSSLTRLVKNPRGNPSTVRHESKESVAPSKFGEEVFRITFPHLTPLVAKTQNGKPDAIAPH